MGVIFLVGFVGTNTEAGSRLHIYHHANTGRPGYECSFAAPIPRVCRFDLQNSETRKTKNTAAWFLALVKVLLPVNSIANRLSAAVFIRKTCARITDFVCMCMSTIMRDAVPMLLECVTLYF